MANVRLATYHTDGYQAEPGRPGEVARYGRLESTVTDELRPDILVLQGMGADTEALWHLADATRLDCQISGARYPFAVGRNGTALGFLWNPSAVQPVQHTWRVHISLHTWACALASMEFVHEGGTIVRVFNYLAPPHNGQPGSPDSQRQAAEAWAIANQLDAHPDTFIAGGWESPWAEIVGDQLYDPRLQYETGATEPLHVARLHRQPGLTLHSVGLRDPAVKFRQEWRPTTGHVRGHTVYRPDRIHYTVRLDGAIRGGGVLDTDLARASSSHLPVWVDYDPADL